VYFCYNSQKIPGCSQEWFDDWFFWEGIPEFQAEENIGERCIPRFQASW
jgi:hypothetical protein